MKKLETESYADMELTIKETEMKKKVEDLERDRDRLIQERNEYEREKEEELKALQSALEDALEEKIKVQTKWERDFAELQESNSCLMDDFEWKLRQIEANCKKKIQDKDKQVSDTAIQNSPAVKFKRRGKMLSFGVIF